MTEPTRRHLRILRLRAGRTPNEAIRRRRRLIELPAADQLGPGARVFLVDPAQPAREPARLPFVREAADEEAGAPVEGVICQLIPDVAEALVEGGSNVPTANDGTCYETGRATGYEIRIIQPATGEVLTTRRARIASGEHVVVRVTLTR